MSKSFEDLVAEVYPNGTCPHSRHFLNEFRHSWIGNRNTVTPKEDGAVFHKHLDEFASSLDALDTELSELVDVLPQTPALHKEMVRELFAVKGHTFHEISKRTPGSIEEELLTAGIVKNVAQAASYAIYKRRREMYFPSNEVEVLSPRSTALKGLSEKDTHVSLRRCSLNYDDFPSFASAIVKNTFLCSLDLSGNNIHTLGAMQLCAILPELPHLHTLLLGGNAIQPKGVAEVCAALEGRRMKVLDLSGNNGGAAMGASIALVSVQKLNVAYNDIGNDGVAALTPAARRCTSLVLSGNNITDGSALAQLLTTCDVLTNVDISYNPTQGGASEVIGAIGTHPALTTVNMMEVGASDADVESMFSDKTSSNLHEVSYSKTPSAKVQEGLRLNKEHSREFHDALMATPVASWTSEDVYNALVILLRRRDIAMQTRIDGQELVQLMGLDNEEDWRDMCSFLDQYHHH